MGLLDKMKNLVGGHGVKVAITAIERQPAASASLPLHDSILKGRIQISGEKEAVILKHVFELKAIYDTEGSYREVRLADSVNEGQIIGVPYTWPYTLRPGQIAEDSFSVGPFEIPAAMQELQLTPEDAASNPKVRIELKAIADVKGTPVDASAKQAVRIIAGAADAASRERRIAELRVALDAKGAVYRIEPGSGEILVSVADGAGNVAKLSAAMDGLGMGGWFSGDWSAVSIGDYKFEKVSGL